ncbi:MAG: 16S rRNA (guanine(527)-N(7))-methyltransferase RsmG [Planctomycetaceae bacterium]|nr:16S rRNA (guanine(527)-N(7))-methyltransferase RsmG [Planctomycetaceae bacterium]
MSTPPADPLPGPSSGPLPGDRSEREGPTAGGDGGADGRAASDAEPDADELELEDRPNPSLADGPLPTEAALLAALEEAFAAEGVAPGVLESYAKHARFVLEGNRRLNLTAIVDPKEIAVKHYLDCFRATRLLPLMGRTVLDLGTGGGFPGMPTALCEAQARVVLLDSRKKRVDFVQESIDHMGLPNATAVWARGEEHLARNPYDVVFVRALSSVRENVRMLRKVRHQFTDLVMFKGPSWSREVRAAEREAERLGFRLDTVWEHELPGGMGQRALLVYRSPGGR